MNSASLNSNITLGWWVKHAACSLQPEEKCLEIEVYLFSHIRGVVTTKFIG